MHLATLELAAGMRAARGMRSIDRETQEAGVRACTRVRVDVARKPRFAECSWEQRA